MMRGNLSATQARGGQGRCLSSETICPESWFRVCLRRTV